MRSAQENIHFAHWGGIEMARHRAAFWGPTLRFFHELTTGKAMVDCLCTVLTCCHLILGESTQTYTPTCAHILVMYKRAMHEGAFQHFLLEL